MKREDPPVSTIAKERAAKFSDFGRRLHPALRFRIERSKPLQRSILFLIQKLDPHSGCEINRIASRKNPFLFSFFLARRVITNTSPAVGAFC